MAQVLETLVSHWERREGGLYFIPPGCTYLSPESLGGKMQIRLEEFIPPGTSYAMMQMSHLPVICPPYLQYSFFQCFSLDRVEAPYPWRPSRHSSWPCPDAVLTEIKSSLTVLKVPWHYNNDVILLTGEKQPLNQGLSVSIRPGLVLEDVSRHRINTKLSDREV